MIVISIGSNLYSHWGNPFETLKYAIKQLKNHSIIVHKQSAPYISNPMGMAYKKNLKTVKKNVSEGGGFILPPLSYVNMNLIIKTHKPAHQLLYCLKQIEKSAGRRRGKRWANRVLDMDIICYNGIILGNNTEQNNKNNFGFIPLTLPHPALEKRAFVLNPLDEIATFWHHPITGKTPKQMINELK